MTHNCSRFVTPRQGPPAATHRSQVWRLASQPAVFDSLRIVQVADGRMMMGKVSYVMERDQTWQSRSVWGQSADGPVHRPPTRHQSLGRSPPPQMTTYLLPSALEERGDPTRYIQSDADSPDPPGRMLQWLRQSNSYAATPSSCHALRLLDGGRLS
jgi:hypothetical protein